MVQKFIKDATSGQPLTIDSCPFTRDGYEFASWNTDKNGLGQEYMPGDVAVFPEPTVLYAMWRKLHDVTLDDNFHEISLDRNFHEIAFDDNLNEITLDYNIGGTY